MNGWKNKETWLVNLWLGDTFVEQAEYHERIDMGRNEAGEWLGFM